MSFWYSLNTIVSVPLEAQHIKSILEKGAWLDFQYFDGSQILSPEEAFDSILTQWHDKKRGPYTQPCIDVHYEDTYFGLHFSEQFGHMTTWLSLSNCCWFKTRSYVNYERYIRLLFHLFNGYPLLWIHAIDEPSLMDFYVDCNGTRNRFLEKSDITQCNVFKVNVTLDAEWDTQTFAKIFERGATSRWKFYTVTSERLWENEISYPHVLESSPKGEIPVSLAIMINEVVYLLTFELRFNSYFMLSIQLLNDSGPLEEAASNALTLSTDFCILELETFNPRYNYYKKPGS